MRQILATLILAALSTFAQAPAKAPTTTPKATEKSTDKAAKDTTKAAPKGELMDINTATAAQLATLPGIGDAYAKKIVDARPFARKDELVSKKIIPQATYDKIKNDIIARQGQQGKTTTDKTTTTKDKAKK
jgi:DNA uptake protein ComE-like DNA-binding protein